MKTVVSFLSVSFQLTHVDNDDKNFLFAGAHSAFVHNMPEYLLSNVFIMELIHSYYMFIMYDNYKLLINKSQIALCCVHGLKKKYVSYIYWMRLVKTVECHSDWPSTDNL